MSIGSHSRLLLVGLLSIEEPLPLSVSLWNDLSDPVFDGVGLEGFKSEPMLSCLHDLLFLFCLLLFYLFLPSMGWLCGVGAFGLIVFFALRIPVNNNNIDKTEPLITTEQSL